MKTSLLENILFFAFLAIIVAVASCEEETSLMRVDANHKVKPDYNTPFTLGVGQKAFFRNSELILQVEDVIEDSRCPLGITCVWQGQVRVITAVTTPNQENNALELIYQEGATAEINSRTFDGFVIELTKVLPAPKEGETIEKSDYRITMKVTKL
jgi:hypothetical protein